MDAPNSELPLLQACCGVFIENRNSFRVESARSGVMIGYGREMIAVYPNGIAVIYDVYTGLESVTHVAHVQPRCASCR